MKRTLLIKTLLRIAFTTMLTSNLTLKLAAHDLPQDAKCYAMTRASVAKLACNSRERTATRKDSTAVATSESANSSNSSSLSSQLGACSLASWNEPQHERVAKRNYRFARTFKPNQVSTVLRSQRQIPTQSPKLASTRLNEEYQPYDLSVRDWRFAPGTVGTSFNSTTFASTPTLVNPITPQPTTANFITLDTLKNRAKKVVSHVAQISQQLALGTLKSRLQGIQISLASSRAFRIGNVVALVDAFRSPLRSGACIALNQIEVNEVGGELPAANPFFNTPPFVYFENSHGLRLVLTQDQAKARGLILPNAKTIGRAVEGTKLANLQSFAAELVQQGRARVSNMAASLQHLSSGAHGLWTRFEAQQTTRIAREPTLIQ